MKKTPLMTTAGAALLGSIAFSAHAGTSPFATEDITRPIVLAAEGHDHEMACGEGMCGGAMNEKDATTTDETSGKGERTSTPDSSGDDATTTDTKSP